MTFKDLKPNDPVYILDQQEVTLKKGKVINVLGPRYSYDEQNGNNNRQYVSSVQTNSSRMVVDVTINYEGRSITYVIPENSTVTFARNEGLVLSVDQQGLLPSVQDINTNAKGSLDENFLKKAKQDLERSTSLLSEINPEFKEKAEQEKRLSNLESDMGDIKSILKDIQKSLNANKEKE